MSLSPTSFTYVAALVRRETAVIYDSGKEYLVEARLLPLAREAGEADVDAYVFRIQRDGDGLVSQIPTLPVATGLVVTHAAGDADMSGLDQSRVVL